ncbi:hypothetical protein SUGI_1184540 [Cryptomeria japonica]|uniref:probable F-box protein At2g36090 n=1 Tax=Cryptomeria japonica TaxID=3369 RepID=UPI002414825D|nr:probable F-box protein At2g36090 [Cryptomeria japonica]GLJ55202.1 hypothetical protein SUGI_1184540 [Cryptomeria japonica]
MDKMFLNSDLITEILGRVDGITLANAGCASSHFRSIARQENIWEEACYSMWPSTKNPYIKQLISSSLGGFRNFYASCFPFIAYDETSESNPRCNWLKTLGDANPSDFVFLVDVQYKNKLIYSQVLWGIPATEDFEGWFSNCPFRIDLIEFDEDHTSLDELTTIVPDKPRKGSEFWMHLMENIKLSWILINKITGKAANLSSWSPLVGQRHWPSDKDSVICFGSIIPAYSILPCKAVQCKFVMKFRASQSDHTNLKITELSMQMEDIMGDHVNGRNSLLILERALYCRRSKRQKKVLESCEKYLRERSTLKEAKMRKECHLDILFTLTGIVAYASVCYFIF